jgi:tetratricopeptide (TPR) repeat protein
MCKRFFGFSASTRKRFGANCRSRSPVVLAAGLVAASLASLAGSLPAFGDDWAAKADRYGEESSILVSTPGASSKESATAKPMPAATADEDGITLEPISQYAERTPDLADAEPSTAQPAASAAQPFPMAAADNSEQFGAALAEVARAKPLSTERAPSRLEPARLGAVTRNSVRFESARFNDIQPGTSTRDDLVKAWGEPAVSDVTDEGSVLTYHTEPFAAIEALIAPDGVVVALKITLDGGLNPKQLAKQLSLEKFDPVTIAGEDERPLGQAFPERGVVFMFEVDLQAPAVKTANPLVTQVAIQALDARAFALRAENRLRGPYQKNIDDLETALAIDPEFAHAYWLLADVYLTTGQADQAAEAAVAACQLDPTSAAYQLRRGQALILLGKYDDAVLETRAVLDRADTAPIVRAQALHEMGRLAALGDAEIASKTISFHTRAIELADQLATSRDPKERRAAKRLLVDAHLAVAEEVARQSFGGKVDALSQWIGRASGLAEDFIASDGGSVELRLHVAQRALGALANFKPTLDPAPWVAEAEEAASALKKQSDDPLWQQTVRWEVGLAYLNALRVEHLRRETTSAVRYGQAAIENLAEGAQSRQAVYQAEQLVGQLYFHVGAVQAVHKQDHQAAVEWYNKAAPLLTAARPISELNSPRRDGELLVSMGVSYWQVGQQGRAIELTQAGANLIEMAVEDGILGRSSLAVPYGNLASMYQQRGETTAATRYSNLAKTVSVAPAAATAQPMPRTGRASTPQAGGRTGMMQTGGQQGRPMARQR